MKLEPTRFTVATARTQGVVAGFGFAAILNPEQICGTPEGRGALGSALGLLAATERSARTRSWRVPGRTR